jgi:hypothetical protein
MFRVCKMRGQVKHEFDFDPNEAKDFYTKEKS